MFIRIFTSRAASESFERAAGRGCGQEAGSHFTLALGLPQKRWRDSAAGRPVRHDNFGLDDGTAPALCLWRASRPSEQHQARTLEYPCRATLSFIHLREHSADFRSKPKPNLRRTHIGDWSGCSAASPPVAHLLGLDHLRVHVSRLEIGRRRVSLLSGESGGRDDQRVARTSPCAWRRDTTSPKGAWPRWSEPDGDRSPLMTRRPLRPESCCSG